MVVTMNVTNLTKRRKLLMVLLGSIFFFQSTFRISAGVDPAFEMGGAQNACISTRKFFFQCHTHFQVHNEVWAPWNCDTIITVGINKLKITILRLCVATAVNIKAFLMQEQHCKKHGVLLHSYKCVTGSIILHSSSFHEGCSMIQ